MEPDELVLLYMHNYTVIIIVIIAFVPVHVVSFQCQFMYFKIIVFSWPLLILACSFKCLACLNHIMEKIVNIHITYYTLVIIVVLIIIIIPGSLHTSSAG